MDRYEFIWHSIQKYGYEMDYREVSNINNLKKDKVTIICPKHGKYYQTAEQHLYYTKGCKGCQYDLLRKLHQKSKDKFIEEAKEIHGDKYDYSKVEYKNAVTKVCIICPIHGEFWMKPCKHLLGQGCSKCKSSHLENEIRKVLQMNNIEFEEQKTFEWLLYKNKTHQYIDFYLPKYNIGIECQGIQHFKADNKRFKDISINLDRDLNKSKLCKENNLKLIYYSKFKFDNITENKEIYSKEEYFTNKTNLLKYIINYDNYRK